MGYHCGLIRTHRMLQSLLLPALLIRHDGQCRGGKAVHMSHKGHRGHEEKVGDLVDNVLLEEHDKVVVWEPAVRRTELQSQQDSFVVLGSSKLSKAFSQQQVVDIIATALKVLRTCSVLMCKNR